MSRSSTATIRSSTIASFTFMSATPSNEPVDVQRTPCGNTIRARRVQSLPVRLKVHHHARVIRGPDPITRLIPEDADGSHTALSGGPGWSDEHVIDAGTGLERGSDVRVAAVPCQSRIVG